VSKNAFELLLESLPEDEVELKGSARKVFGELADKIPKLKDSVLAQADYSRRMDEVRTDVELSKKWKDWRAANWLDDKNMTKEEEKKFLRIQELETELEKAQAAAVAAGTGEEMTFEQLTQFGDKLIKDKGIVTADGLKARIEEEKKSLEEYIKGNNQGLGTAILDIPTIMLKHQKEFDEILDAREVVKAANAKQRTDLVDFYDKDWVIERRNKANEEKHAAQLKKVQDDADAKVKAAEEKAEKLKQSTMAQTGGSVVDMGGPELGILQKQLVPAPPGEGEVKAPEVPIGDGSIAAFAARQYLQKQAERRAS
jgi:hypothetical protein